MNTMMIAPVRVTVRTMEHLMEDAARFGVTVEVTVEPTEHSGGFADLSGAREALAAFRASEPEQERYPIWYEGSRDLVGELAWARVAGDAARAEELEARIEREGLRRQMGQAVGDGDQLFQSGW